jgi:glycosyltransferase involved in cell wall biosynthesis
MITVGFTFIGRGGWSGGETYLRNMLGVMQTELNGQVRAKLFLTPEQHAKVGGSFDKFLMEPAIVDKRVENAGFGKRALKAIAFGLDREFAELVVPHKLDVIFENAQWFGNRFPVPVMSWIPDFQHHYMPELFSQARWWRRDIGYRVQTGGKRDIIVSSLDAKSDCEKIYPSSRGKTHVVRFAIDIDPAAAHARTRAVRLAHQLPARFFYLPNQFWAHKNHLIVVEALNVLKKEGRLESVLPVFLTGRTDDARDPHLFHDVMELASSYGVASHFKHLGLIPYADVFALNAACDALINPSKFEGWSTPVEEAKALGTPLLLSGLRIHIEQAPDAVFFHPDDAASLANQLLRLSQQAPRPPADLAILQTVQIERRGSYATELYQAFKSTQCRSDGPF